MRKKSFFLTAATVLALSGFVLASNAAHAEGSYGVNNTYNTLVVDKFVNIPRSGNTFTSNTYVDNLLTKDGCFATTDNVYFMVKVKNVGDKTMNSVQLTDILPREVSMVEGSGVFMTEGNNVIITAGDLAPGEEKIFYIKTNIVNANAGTTQTLAKVYGKGNINGVLYEDSDSSQFCIENKTNKKFEGLTMFPKTGPEHALGLLAVQVALIGAGLKMRKIS